MPSADDVGTLCIGRVRLWNPMWSSIETSNGRKIVKVNSDIGFFSVGDPFKREHDLVVYVSPLEIVPLDLELTRPT